MKLRQSKGNGVALSNAGFIENYLRKELCFFVHFQVRSIKRELVALFQHCGHSGDTSPYIAIPLVKNGREAIYCRDSSVGRDEHVVLIDGVKTVETPQRVIPSFVWVNIPDRLYDLLPHALYLGGKSGFTLLGRNRAFEDWELRMWSGDVASAPNESTCEAIEGTPQIVNRVAHNCGGSWWEGLCLEDMDHWLRRVRFDIYPQAVRLRIDECPKGDFEIGEMFLGPFDFLANV